jgi:hypothetical protein
MSKSNLNTIDGSDYGTRGEAFNDIARNACYGNWRDAANLAVDEGLYAQDLIDLNNEALDGFGWFPNEDDEEFQYHEYGFGFQNKDDIAILSEMMAEIRAHKLGVAI